MTLWTTIIMFCYIAVTLPLHCTAVLLLIPFVFVAVSVKAFYGRRNTRLLRAMARPARRLAINRVESSISAGDTWSQQTYRLFYAIRPAETTRTSQFKLPDVCYKTKCTYFCISVVIVTDILCVLHRWQTSSSCESGKLYYYRLRWRHLGNKNMVDRSPFHNYWLLWKPRGQCLFSVQYYYYIYLKILCSKLWML